MVLKFLCIYVDRFTPRCKKSTSEKTEMFLTYHNNNNNNNKIILMQFQREAVTRMTQSEEFSIYLQILVISPHFSFQ